jgi:hypothetical protein
MSRRNFWNPPYSPPAFSPYHSIKDFHTGELLYTLPLTIDFTDNSLFDPLYNEFSMKNYFFLIFRVRPLLSLISFLTWPGLTGKEYIQNRIQAKNPCILKIIVK